jgi:ParB family chromosome partitioning protein
VAGERRFRASKIAGLDKIPAILTKGDPLEISIVENLQRENLNPVEEAEALSKMISNHGYTQEKLAFAIGKAKSTISETISINRLPEEVKEEVRRAEQPFSRRQLVEIAKLDTPEAMLSLFSQVKAGNLKSDEVRTIVRKRAESIKRTPAEIALERTLSLKTFLDKIDFTTIEESQKIQLATELQNLKDKIEEMIL